jgi:hypothetical protein
MGLIELIIKLMGERREAWKDSCPAAYALNLLMAPPFSGFPITFLVSRTTSAVVRPCASELPKRLQMPAGSTCHEDRGYSFAIRI